ncbi:hypothetical protein [Halorussus salinisoli]|uniref:hypothetical protein n=1 Tax=Halorussus salinisoli TaxID=2558242 RepID=UPI0010C1F73C|nr:hypothetical protein [Halorussus salinisoli]
MASSTETDLTALTTNQKVILKVLVDADGEALRGMEVRRQARENYGVEMSRSAMNGARREGTAYPKHMVDETFYDTNEGDVDYRHATHRLKPEYIDTVREQLQ